MLFLDLKQEMNQRITYLNQFSQRFKNTAKGLITFKLLNQTKQSEQQLYKDSTRFRDLTMRILKSAFYQDLCLSS